MKKKILITISMIASFFIVTFMAITEKRTAFAERNTTVFPANTVQSQTLCVGTIGDSWVAGRKLDTGITEELTKNGIPCKVLSFGEPGATSKEIYYNLFKDPKTLYSSNAILRVKPRFCIIVCGVNDIIKQYPCAFYAHHTALIARALLDNGIRPIIMTVPQFGIKEFRATFNPMKRLWCYMTGWYCNQNDVQSVTPYRQALEAELKKDTLTAKVRVVQFDDIIPGDYEHNRSEYYNPAHLKLVVYKKLGFGLAERATKNM